MLGLADAAECIGLKTNSVKLWAYLIKNLTIARILTIDKIVLLKTNTNIHFIISALLSAISAFISDLKAKFLYKSSFNMAISCVIICCLLSTVFAISSLMSETNCSASFSPNLALTKLYNLISEIFSASALHQTYAFKGK